MKDIFWQPAALLEQATGCRPWVSSVCAIVLVPFISGSLWHANGRIQQGCSRFLKVRCSNYCLLRSKDIERKAGKDQILPFPNIPKPSTSESFHLHHPTSIKIQHSYQAASVPGVPSGCAFSDAVSLSSAAMPVSFTSATWGKEELLKPLAWYSWGWKYILMGNGLQVQDIAIESKRVLSLSLAKLS